MSSPSSSPVILLIHGTGAGDPEDVGRRWWQRGSGFEDSLRRALPDGFLSQPRVFHWSGRNSETDRRAAGRRLLQWLLDYEAQGVPYHLIGHSHGGSVIWHSLVEARRRGRALRCLRSWSTVGTPFLFFEAAPRGSMLLALLVVGAMLGWVTVRAAVVSSHAEELVSVGAVSALVAFVVAWLVLAALFGFGIIHYGVAVLAGRRLRRDNEVARRVFADFEDRWLGVWSGQDEAINGLRQTLGFRGPIVPRIRPSLDGVLGPPIAVATVPVRALYNGMIAPLSDEFVWYRASQALQGCDVPGFTLVDVSCVPVGAAEGTAPLMPTIEEQLTGLANREAGAVVAKARALLGTASPDAPDVGSFVMRVRNQLTWNELVHNSYFDVEAIREALTRHILEPERKDGSPSSAQSGPSRSALARVEPCPGDSRRLARALVGSLALGSLLIGGMSITVYRGAILPVIGRGSIATLVADTPVEESVFVHDTLALSHWIEAAGEAGFVERAERTLDRLDDEDRARARVHFARGLAQAGEFDRARAAAVVTGHTVLDDNELGALGEILLGIQANASEAAAHVVLKSQGLALAGVALGAAHRGDVAAARTSSRNGQLAANAIVSAAVAGELAAHGHAAEAKAMARSAAEDVNDASDAVLAPVAKGLIDVGDLIAGLKLSRRVRDPLRRAQVMSFAAEAARAAKRSRTLSLAILRRAERAGNRAAPGSARDRVFAVLAMQYDDVSGGYKRREGCIRSIADQTVRLATRLTLLARHSRDALLETFETDDPPAVRFALVTQMAAQLATVLPGDVLTELLAPITTPRLRAYAALTLGSRLVDEQRTADARKLCEVAETALADEEDATDRLLESVGAAELRTALGDVHSARRTLRTVLREIDSVQIARDRSYVLRGVATVFARMGWWESARRACGECFVSDKMRVSTLALGEFAQREGLVRRDDVSRGLHEQVRVDPARWLRREDQWRPRGEA